MTPTNNAQSFGLAASAPGLDAQSPKRTINPAALQALDSRLCELHFVQLSSTAAGSRHHAALLDGPTRDAVMSRVNTAAVKVQATKAVTATVTVFKQHQNPGRRPKVNSRQKTQSNQAVNSTHAAGQATDNKSNKDNIDIG